MSTKIPVFVTGATGYIGGTVVSQLLGMPNVQITALIRSEEKAQKFKELGVANPVVGDQTDYKKVEDLSEDAEVVIQMSATQDEDLVKSILAGLKKRFEKTGQKPVYIHISGSGCVMDNAKGEFKTEKIYSDMDHETLINLPMTAPYRAVEQLVYDADEAGYVHGYIVSPCTVYGKPKGVVADAGIQHMLSLQIPTISKVSVARKQAGYVGKGLSVWSDVHVNDTADLFIAVFKSAVEQPGKAGHGLRGYHFAADQEHDWITLGRQIGKELSARGIGSAEPTPMTEEEVATFFPVDFYVRAFSSNSRVVAERGRQLGWKPTHTDKILVTSLDIEAALA